MKKNNVCKLYLKNSHHDNWGKHGVSINSVGSRPVWTVSRFDAEEARYYGLLDEMFHSGNNKKYKAQLGLADFFRTPFHTYSRSTEPVSCEYNVFRQQRLERVVGKGFWHAPINFHFQKKKKKKRPLPVYQPGLLVSSSQWDSKPTAASDVNLKVDGSVWVLKPHMELYNSAFYPF